MSDQTLTTDQIQSALEVLIGDSSLKVQNGLKMLKANYRSPDRKISAARLAKAANYSHYNTGNEQYGSFAHKLCELAGFEPEKRADDSPRWTYAICSPSTDKDNNGHFQWILRPEAALAMENLGLVETVEFPDALEDIAAKASIYEDLAPKYWESVQKARIGQGVFRENLIKHWGGCAVTGCDQLDLLVASHIKPWRDCNYSEALDVTNGLLLLPNLDFSFDKGFITFDDEGNIIFSPQLSLEVASQLGLSKGMKLRHIYSYHQNYLKHHRAAVFRKTT